MHKILPIPALKDNYIWTIIHTNTQQCMVVDPGDADVVLEVLTQLKLKLAGILVTHHHWDHTQGIPGLLKEFSVPVFGPENPQIPGLSHPLKDGDHLIHSPMQLDLEVLAIPGHTLDHIAYYGHNAVFSGDTLFTGGCGRVFEGTPPQMYHSLERLRQLPDNTSVYCGHEYTENNLQFAQRVEPSNHAIQSRSLETAKLRELNKPTVPALLSLEKETNPFLRCHLENIKQAAQEHFKTKADKPEAVFAQIRRWKDEF
jgi:hydroxyacylglutathione hydrolase